MCNIPAQLCEWVWECAMQILHLLLSGIWSRDIKKLRLDSNSQTERNNKKERNNKGATATATAGCDSRTEHIAAQWRRVHTHAYCACANVLCWWLLTLLVKVISSHGGMLAINTSQVLLSTSLCLLSRALDVKSEERIVFTVKTRILFHSFWRY